MPETSIVLPSKPRAVSENETRGTYEIGGLYPGYGHTLGNSLRRIILSSLAGSAITNVKIEGVNNEYSTIEGVYEDVMTILLNLKNVRLRMATEEPQSMTLKAKGVKNVTAGDIQTSGQVEIINPDLVIAQLTDKNASLDMEMTVEQGLGYMPKESLKQDSSIGTMAMDAVFSPITRIKYTVEDMRVGDRTDYNRLVMDIETDGTLSPREALERAILIMYRQLEALFAEDASEKPRMEVLDTTNAEGVVAASGSADSEDPEAVESSKEESAEDPTEFLKTRVEDLELSPRTLNALSNANIRTVGGLARKKEADILNIEGIGDKGLQEIKEVLTENGIELKV